MMPDSFIIPQPLWLPLLLGAIVTVLITPLWIQWQKNRVLGQAIREEGLQSHQVKSGTPTAGGLVFLLVWVLVSTVYLIVSQGSLAPQSILIILSTLVLGGLGFVDDALKMAKKQNKGVGGYTKLAVQTAVGFGLGGYMLVDQQHDFTNIFGFIMPLGLAYPLFTAWVMAAFSNAVNLTDGVDGLAASTLMVSLLSLAVLLVPIATLLGTSQQLAILAAVAVGCLIGFLWFNRYPAKLFMGDTGSLAMGGLLAGIGILSGMEWWLLAFGLLFVLEALSVTLQVASVKCRNGQRLFKMSPIHHHFELCGWSENKIVRVFVAVQIVGCLIGLLLLPQLLTSLFPIQ